MYDRYTLIAARHLKYSAVPTHWISFDFLGVPNVTTGGGTAGAGGAGGVGNDGGAADLQYVADGYNPPPTPDGLTPDGSIDLNNNGIPDNYDNALAIAPGSIAIDMNADGVVDEREFDLWDNNNDGHLDDLDDLNGDNIWSWDEDTGLLISGTDPNAPVFSFVEGGVTYSGGVGSQLFVGSFEDDDGSGGADFDILHGYNGDDTLSGEGGDDSLFGGNGNDSLFGGPGDDYLMGMAGDDDISIGGGQNTVYGNDGNDYVFAVTEGSDLIYLNGGNDTFYSLSLISGQDSFTVYAGSGADLVDASLGDDFLYGGQGKDTINGGAGHDYIEGGGDNDLLNGSNGNDTLSGFQGNDTIFGGDGNDILNGGSGADDLFGEAGDDTLEGGKNADELFGGTGNDSLQGFAGIDVLAGGAGFDTLVGGSGADTLDGGAGNDSLVGGANADIFVFSGGFGVDTIGDFDPSGLVEAIDLSGVTSIVDWLDLQSNHLSTVAGNAVITDASGNSITLDGVSASSLSASDFVF